MEPEAVAKLKIPGEAVLRDGVALHHLRPGRAIGVLREQRIVHHVAVLVRGQRSVHDRIERGQVEFRHEAERAGASLRTRKAVQRWGGEKSRAGGEDGATRGGHDVPPCLIGAAKRMSEYWPAG